ncbi:hypothetical protein BDV37DRAFT_238239 [Aspergillus pseudonomiae]|uniref:Uncharacterized protein n=1 Tax=Aspergillus pseudonomiae TaxID=1506151 RepID=A0A5N7DQK5_9EURO|nr:uncharacterized protein BDV37DRAFT_238239 [Aspergillus pseudonomiae]KAE8408737.1 hypothetical protein BDV37DRAFT_238239 [Aspergillus pseudonomiae]
MKSCSMPRRGAVGQSHVADRRSTPVRTKTVRFPRVPDLYIWFCYLVVFSWFTIEELCTGIVYEVLLY